MARRSFTFINQTGKPDSTQRKENDIPTIRSHAMREVRRRKDLALRATLMSNAAPGSSEATEDNSDTDRLQPYRSTVGCSRALSSILHGTAIGSKDLSGQVLQHLYYFVQGFKPLTFPVTYIRHSCDVARIALSRGNLAVLHALCAVSTLHQRLTRATATADRSLRLESYHNTTDRVFLYHKQQAIVSLQIGLSSSKGFQDPSFMATVVLLLLIESLSGDIVTSNTHRRGLVELVARYGVPHKATDLMSSDILMTDIKSATSSLSKPAMKPCASWVAEFDRLGTTMFVPHRPELLFMGSGFTTLRVREALNPALIQPLRAMRNLINGVEQNFDMGIDVSGVTGVHVLSLEHCLLSLDCNTGEETDSSRNISECCRIACLLYCNVCLWTLSNNTTLLRNLLSYLQAALSVWEPEPLCDQQCSLLLWFNFVGSFAASSTEQCQPFTKGMRDMARLLDIRNESEFRSIMGTFFYVERLMGEHLTASYDEIK